ncbi:MAG: hypothetical protein JWL93_193 [Hyphomicrobiales bacterium]|nr:hypothetical protein [Hyphomicrobiales bacterium]
MRNTAPRRTRSDKHGPGALRHLDWWRRSPEFREIMRQAGLRAVERWRQAPKCGARKRSDGEPCRNPGLEPSGRCRFHGGKTPRGKAWHRVTKRETLSDKGAAIDSRKLQNKIKAAAARAKRLAAMTPEEREAYQRWQAAHRPGPPGARASARARRQQDREAAALFAQDKTTPIDPEAAELRAMIEELERQKREAELAFQFTQGVFQ